MSLTVKIGEAKTRLSELLAKVEAGEEVVIARSHEPIARLTRVPKPDDFSALVAEVKAARAKRDEAAHPAANAILDRVDPIVEMQIVSDDGRLLRRILRHGVVSDPARQRWNHSG